MREGGCLCGAVRYSVEGEPEASGICHCETCRRAASAPTLPYAIFQSDRFAFSKGSPREYKSSPLATRTFCGECGSPLTYRAANVPDRVDVMICSLDDPGAIIPTYHVWAREKVSWDRIADDLPAYSASRASKA